LRVVLKVADVLVVVLLPLLLVVLLVLLVLLVASFVVSAQDGRLTANCHCAFQSYTNICIQRNPTTIGSSVVIQGQGI
jgi:hypothetical protein